MKKLFLSVVLLFGLLSILIAWTADWQWTTAVYKARAVANVITQPMDLADAAEQEQQRQKRQALVKIKQQYQPVQQSLNDDDLGAAAERLQGFIERHPSFVQPYLDLAAHHANAGQLAAARLTLIQALKADSQTALLYANLQKVQGALAANAYKEALNEGADVINRLGLPRVAEIKPVSAVTK